MKGFLEACLMVVLVSSPALLVVADDARVDDVPALPQVASWLAHYGWKAVPADQVATWSSAYPTTGSTVDHFRWQLKILTPAVGIPSEYAGGMVATLDVLLPVVLRDSVKVRLEAVDQAGNGSGWSEWGDYRNSHLEMEEGGP